MAAERIIRESTEVSPTTGLEYNVTTTEVVDACRDCGGEGVIRYSSFADLREHVNAMALWEDEEGDDDPPEPKQSQTKPCERCGGTGIFKDDGGRFIVTMSVNITTMLPK